MFWDGSFYLKPRAQNSQAEKRENIGSVGWRETSVDTSKLSLQALSLTEEETVSGK